MDYETTGALLGMGDRMRRERAEAQRVVDRLADVARHNLAELNKANAIIANQNAYIAQLEARLRRQSGRA